MNRDFTPCVDKPIREAYGFEDALQTFDLPYGSCLDDIVAQWDGKPKRRPKKGEWFINKGGAYRAAKDLAHEYQCAVLVLTAVVRTQVTKEEWMKVQAEKKANEKPKRVYKKNTSKTPKKKTRK